METSRWAVLVTLTPGPGPSPLLDVSARRTGPCPARDMGEGRKGWTLAAGSARVSAEEASALHVRTSAGGRLEARVGFPPAEGREDLGVNARLVGLELRDGRVIVLGTVTAASDPRFREGSLLRMRIPVGPASTPPGAPAVLEPTAERGG